MQVTIVMSCEGRLVFNRTIALPSENWEEFILLGINNIVFGLEFNTKKEDIPKNVNVEDLHPEAVSRFRKLYDETELYVVLSLDELENLRACDENEEYHWHNAPEGTAHFIFSEEEGDEHHTSSGQTVSVVQDP